jgi:hypothetical protein
MSQPTVPTPPTGGIFISKGMRVGIPAGGFRLTITESGEVDGTLVLHAARDVTPHWFSIALGHLVQAESDHPRLAPAWQRQDNEEITRVLEAEFVSSMQAMMSAATAIDAFYAAVKEHVPIPAATLKAWREKGTARHRQVYEVFRRGFKIGKTALPKVREALGEIYRFRDLVHPNPKLAQPLIHPNLGGVGTEWRFVYFRYENAKPLVSVALGMVVQLLDIPKDRNEGLKRFCQETGPFMRPLVEGWEGRYGQLYPRPKPPSGLSGEDEHGAG